MIFATWTVAARAQEQNKLQVSLKLNESVEQFSGQIIATTKPGSGLVYTTLAGNGRGLAPGNVLVKLEPLNDPLFAYKVSVDSDGNSNFNEPSQAVKPNSSIVVRVNRHWNNGKQQTLPYSIKYSRDPDQNGQMRERFLWLPHYRAEGRLKTQSCDALLVLLDLTSDGQFDSEDPARGTNIGLDRNGDANISGQDEYLRGTQIIEYCNQGFLVDGFAIDGTSVTLTPTSLRVPRVGELLPAFLLATLDGTTIESKDLTGRVFLLDFWASWCKPCVEKFDLVKRLSDEFKDVSIIAMNVDEEANLRNAKQIVKDYRLTWPLVMSGRGESDPIWKMFGGMEGNRLAIPLYVLVDTKGRLRYAGNGGNDLSELRAELKRLLVKE